MGRSVVELRDIWVHRRGRPTCRGVSFKVATGQVVALVGPPGSGKSTALRCLALEDRPTSGRVMLHGVDITGATGEKRRQLRSRSIRLVEPARWCDGLDGRTPTEVVLIDEPLAGVEVAARPRLLDWLQRLRQQPTTSLVIATRDIDVAGVFADEVVVLDDGAVAEAGSVTQVLGSPRSSATRELLAGRLCSA